MTAPPSRRAATTLELKGDLAEIATLGDALERFGTLNAVSAEVLTLLNLALDEIVTNIISYGYADGGDHSIQINLAVEGGQITARVEDDGLAFDAFQKDDPSIDAPLGNRGIGGLGLHLVKSLMDEVRYSRENGRNVLFIRKGLTAGTA